MVIFYNATSLITHDLIILMIKNECCKRNMKTENSPYVENFDLTTEFQYVDI